MNTLFFTLHDFMVHSKGVTYLIMGGILLALPLFWWFLTERDDEN